jgi:hypothetical protein
LLNAAFAIQVHAFAALITFAPGIVQLSALIAVCSPTLQLVIG